MTREQLEEMCFTYAQVMVGDYTKQEQIDTARELACATMEYFGWTVQPDGTFTKEGENMKVINANGTEIDYNAAVELMDDEIREKLAADIAPCTDQEFFTAYEKAHAEKFGEEWELSKENPTY